MQMIDSIPQYQIIYRHYPRILCYITSIEAKYFHFGMLYEALCDMQCATCGDFGGYLYLITCLRVCYTCFTENERFLPMGMKQATKLTGYSRKELRQLPHIRSICGRYADNGRLHRDRLTLWDRGALLSIRTTTSVFEKSDRHCNDPRRFMAIVSAPYFDRSSKTAKYGLYCLGCSESHDRETYFRKQYSEKGFLSHITLYGPVLVGDAEDRPRHAVLEKHV